MQHTDEQHPWAARPRGLRAEWVLTGDGLQMRWTQAAELTALTAIDQSDEQLSAETRAAA
jgi:hypothetical protein